MAMNIPDSLENTNETIRDLDRTMRQQTVADLPICSLRSGGLDSWCVMAMEQIGSFAQGHSGGFLFSGLC
jgi:asparagine synthetase B (glutamine-hydrolysing)